MNMPKGFMKEEMAEGHHKSLKPMEKKEGRRSRRGKRKSSRGGRY